MTYKIYIEKDFSIIYKIVYYIVPNLERFGNYDLFFIQNDIAYLNIITISLYAFFYIAFILSITIIIFNKTEFEKAWEIENNWGIFITPNFQIKLNQDAK